MDEREERALLRIRVLRRDGYRCGHRDPESRRACGKPASLVGSGRTAEPEAEPVALCLRHGR